MYLTICRKDGHLIKYLQFPDILRINTTELRNTKSYYVL